MAAKLRISKTSYGNIERSSIKRLTLAMVMAIAEVLQVHYSELLGEEKKQYRRERSGEAAGAEAVKNYMQHLLMKIENIEKQLQRMQWP